VQFIFSLAARSQAMLADCAAMSVDSLTYLVNFYAERIKHREDTEEEKALPLAVLHRRRKLQRLYLELFPPLVSVTTLVTVTIISLKQAIVILVDDEKEKTPDVIIMLVFSALNLILDAVNVTCFARAEQAEFPTAIFHHDPEGQTEENDTELTGLLKKRAANPENSSQYDTTTADESSSLDQTDDDESQASREINLNMCSAWTVSFPRGCCLLYPFPLLTAAF
jgi:Co/Zn/Cd efflux system component